MGGMKDLLGDTPFDLFSPHATPARASTKEKAKGMAAADASANAAWKLNMRQCLIDIAKKKQFFTSDDVLELAEARGQLSGTHDPRAFGPLIVKAAKDGACRKADKMPIKSRRRHDSPITVWESLIWNRSHD